MKCEVIRDLLPNYIDGLCCDESTKMIQEHLKQCDACRKLYNEMQEPVQNVSDIHPGQDTESENQTKEIAVFRAMKKIVWHRIVGMVIGITLSLIIIIASVFLILSQFHPEWEGPTVEHYLMKQTARQAANDFIQGDMKGYTKGIYNMYHSSTLPYTTVNEDAYNLYIKRMQKLYDSNSSAFTSSIDEISTGYISFDDASPNYSVTVELKNGLVLNFYFTNTEIYTAEVCAQDNNDSIELFDEFNSYLTMLSGGILSEKSCLDKFYQICKDIQNGKIKNFSTHTIETLFSENCEYDYTNHIMHPSERVQQWKKNLFSFLEQNQINYCGSIELPIDQESQKERRKLILQITDSKGNEGIYTKEFYYGMSGYEPVDDKYDIYGDLDSSCRNKLKTLFQ